MWCPHCQSDVAAEVTSDNRRISCASCGTEISSSQPLGTASKTGEARDLLERWSSERLLDPYGPLPGSQSRTSSDGREKPTAAPNLAVVSSGPAGSDSAGSTFRIDRPHPMGGNRETATPLTPTTVGGFSQSPGASSSTIPMPSGTRIEAAHSQPMREPHFDVRSAVTANEERRKTNWAGVTGQLLAYLGVLGLTIGTSLVLLGHFRGPESYTATGWLITTAGQMLLFLGVVTLVSGGLEQTTDEVARRIDRLGEKILRIEQALSAQAAPPHPQRNVEAPPSASAPPSAVQSQAV